MLLQDSIVQGQAVRNRVRSAIGLLPLGDAGRARERVPPEFAVPPKKQNTKVTVVVGNVAGVGEGSPDRRKPGIWSAI